MLTVRSVSTLSILQMFDDRSFNQYINGSMLSPTVKKIVIDARSPCYPEKSGHPFLRKREVEIVQLTFLSR